jgi:hypothetical protein
LTDARHSPPPSPLDGGGEAGVKTLSHTDPT